MQGSSDSYPALTPDRGSSSGDVPALGSPGAGLSRALLRKGADKAPFLCGLNNRAWAGETPVSSGERALPADLGKPCGAARLAKAGSPGSSAASGLRSHAAPALRAQVASMPLFVSESLHQQDPPSSQRHSLF